MSRMMIPADPRLDCILAGYLPDATTRFVASVLFQAEELLRAVNASTLEEYNAAVRDGLLVKWADDLETRPQRCRATTRKGHRCTRPSQSWRVDHCEQHGAVKQRQDQR